MKCMNRIISRTLFGVMLCGVTFGAFAKDVSGEKGLSVFLADPELGVVGSYNLDGSIVYFEARDSGDGAIAARLLDENGQEIAVAGGASFEDWGQSGYDYKPNEAMKSQHAAGKLANAIALAVTDPVLAPEQHALIELAQQVSFADLSAQPFYPSVATPLARSTNRIASDDFYNQKGAELVLGMGKDGNQLTGTYQGVELAAFTKLFTDEKGVDGEELPPREEVYARISVDGRPLNTTFGGDLRPAGWSDEEEQTDVTSDANPFEQIGRAVMAAQVLSKSIDPDMASSLKLGTLIEMGSSMRHYILPAPLTENELEEITEATKTQPKAGAWWYLTYAQIWRKPLVTGNFTGRHSGVRSKHYKKWNSGSSQYNHMHNLCNHGACPGDSSMSYKCQANSGWRSAWRHGVACSTGYSICLGTNRHNCHDDTARELNMIKQGSTWGSTSGRCGDFLCSRYEPNCTEY